MAVPKERPIAALVVAAGRGSRARGEIPKQYQSIGGTSILARSLRPFLDHPNVALVAAVIHPDDTPLYSEAAPRHPKLLPPINGGANRQASVRLGLFALAERPPAFVLIHDAARPFADSALVDRVIDALADHPAVLPAVAVPDTLKRADEGGTVLATLPREHVYAAQTPQGFRFDVILKAHRAAADGGGFTDDAAVAEAASIAVKIVAGDPANIKMTTAEDIAGAEMRMAVPNETRVGTGYDVHAFAPGDHVTLGGVRIPYERKLVGHSDADVVLHALTDAVLGAIGDGDIGDHFPPSDPALADAASDRFLSFSVERMRERGGTIVNLDVTVVAESPRIGPHRAAMRELIAAICGVDADRISVKATTNERLGFVGRAEGVAALAIAAVRLPIK